MDVPPNQANSDLPTPLDWLAAGQEVGEGRYCFRRKLGQGCAGVVWLAWDQQLRELAALKFLWPQIVSSPGAMARWRREMLGARKLSHPNIARIHDLCEAPGQWPFAVMEYVEGSDIAAVALPNTHGLWTWREVVPWLRELCAALDYAHSQGVIHRNLKPSNLLFTNARRLKLADSGLANLVPGEAIHYLSPRQLEDCEPHITDDVYSVGAILYQALTSQPPFHSGDIAFQIRQTRPLTIEERLLELGLENEFPADASALVMSCLAKDPGQRPQSIGAILDWLECDPGLAQPSPPEPEALPVPIRAPRNFRGTIITGGLVLAMLLAGGALWHGWKTRSVPPLLSPPETTTEDAATEAEPALQEEPKSAGSVGAQTPSAKAKAAPAFSLAGHSATVHAVAFSPDGRWIISGSADQTIRIWDSESGALRQTLGGNIGKIYTLAIARNGRVLAGGGEAGAIQLWDLATGELIRKIAGHQGAIHALVFSSEGTRLYSAGADKKLRGWHPQSGALETTFQGHSAAVLALALSPDGRTLASGGADRAILLWDLRARSLSRMLSGHGDAVHAVAFSNDGQALASASRDHAIHWWDPQTGTAKRSVKWHQEVAEALAFSPDGLTLATGCKRKAVHLFELPLSQQKKRQLLSAHTGPVYAIAFSPDGQWLASGSADATVKVWRMSSARNSR